MTGGHEHGNNPTQLTEERPISVTELAWLEGGPKDFPNELRLRVTGKNDDRIKVQHRGGYEHFERTDERRALIEGEAVVFRWTTRTLIAE